MLNFFPPLHSPLFIYQFFLRAFFRFFCHLLLLHTIPLNLVFIFYSVFFFCFFVSASHICHYFTCAHLVKCAFSVNVCVCVVCVCAQWMRVKWSKEAVKHWLWFSVDEKFWRRKGNPHTSPHGLHNFLFSFAVLHACACIQTATKKLKERKNVYNESALGANEKMRN